MIYTDRCELKYLIDYKTYKEIIKFASHFTVKDRNAGKGGTYMVNSLYYDTTDNRLYFEKINGEKTRKKIRIRSYFDSKNGKLLRTILEIKKKDKSTVYKEKIKLNFDDAVKLIETSNIGKYTKTVSASDKRALDDTLYLKYKLGLRPKIMIAYERQALFDKYTPSVRLTFDSNVCYRTCDLTNNYIPTEKYAIPRNLMILEIKYSKYLPIWITKLIQAFDLTPTTVSKYCAAVNDSLTQKDF